ncbi:DUF3471 domain-containing protein [Natronogracilivirga saccharolytica]|uniref:DUF3471 domain-containing protein n=1 Tax=Natronogracilivirga saccharolytica TaxID=2812953 RepID=A0A8J7S7X1_9BACT|nr:DUF3471 domain-containing protein [Natronogracilivirga saccharolytica]MBP3191786.1 DUF3471 domain-containing protein [Natronogracilivirga saccharolytica]
MAFRIPPMPVILAVTAGLLFQCSGKPIESDDAGETGVPDLAESQEFSIEELDKFAGTYASVDDLPDVSVFRDEERLFARFAGASVKPLYAVSENKFENSTLDARFRFEEFRNDLAQNLYYQPGEEDAYLFRRMIEADVAIDPEIIFMETEDLDEYTGTYEMPGGLKLTISRDNDSLTAGISGQDDMKIRPRERDVFFYREVDAELHFHRDSDGKVNAATLHQDGQQLKFLKK